MAFTPKSWQNYPSSSTPVNAAALIDLETRLSGYTDTVGTTTWLKDSADYGVAPVAKAAAITTPTSDTVGTKAAIDSIRTALANYGITA